MKWKFYRIDPRMLKHHDVTWAKAYKYAKFMDAGASFPPVRVSPKIGGGYLVQDGAHRTMAAKLTGSRLLIKTKMDIRLSERVEKA